MSGAQDKSKQSRRHEAGRHDAVAIPVTQSALGPSPLTRASKKKKKKKKKGRGNKEDSVGRSVSKQKDMRIEEEQPRKSVAFSDTST